LFREFATWEAWVRTFIAKLEGFNCTNRPTRSRLGSQVAVSKRAPSGTDQNGAFFVPDEGDFIRSVFDADRRAPSDEPVDSLSHENLGPSRGHANNEPRSGFAGETYRLARFPRWRDISLDREAHQDKDQCHAGLWKMQGLENIE
jgi:hypothetical protein